MNERIHRRALGPPGHWLLGHIPQFRRDLLHLLGTAAADYGDIVRFRLGPRLIHLLNHPDFAEHVLQKNHGNYDKQTRSASFIRVVSGDSLLVSNGEVWQQQRRLLQPAFHRQSIAAFAPQMIDATQAMLDGWRKRTSVSEPVDVASEMMRLTYTVVGRTLFSADVGPDAETIERALQVIMPQTFARLGRLFNWPEWVPTRGNRRFRDALQAVDETVYRLIREHRAAQANHQVDRDLLSILLRVRDETNGSGFTDAQLRNHTVTFLLAGHETTANCLTWTFYLLSTHPEHAKQLQAEVDSVLAGRRPTIEDLPRLVFAKRVIQESLRLYPPIWISERRVINDDVLGGVNLPAGSAVVIAAYTLHRHPHFWEAPEVFDPERFSQPPPRAYIPFGIGPRHCIGNEFAMLEAQLILALVTQAFELRLVPEHPVEPMPGITLRARHGVLMTLHPRN